MNKTNNRIVKLVGYILDYAPVIATVLAATAAALSATRSGAKIEEMLQWALIVLSLLAVTQLIDRFRLMRGIDAKLDSVIETSQGANGATYFFTERVPDLSERYHEAKSISINGITLSSTTDTYWGVFKQRIREGCRVRLLIIDPEHSALEVAANRFHKHQDPQRVKREIEHTFDNIESLIKEGGASELFQVRLLPYVPPYGIRLIDANSPRAEIWVELYTFRDEPEPTFQLLPHRDGAWFNFFQEQFETMWDASRVWRPH